MSYLVQCELGRRLKGGEMATFDIIVSISSIVLAAVTIAYMAYLARVSGRDRPHDPERLRRFIANAPYNLDGERHSQKR
jgi:hypothetical protein